MWQILHCTLYTVYFIHIHCIVYSQFELYVQSRTLVRTDIYQYTLMKLSSRSIEVFKKEPKITTLIQLEKIFMFNLSCRINQSSILLRFPKTWSCFQRRILIYSIHSVSLRSDNIRRFFNLNLRLPSKVKSQVVCDIDTNKPRHIASNGDSKINNTRLINRIKQSCGWSKL